MDGMRMEFLYNAVGFSGWNICYEWMACGILRLSFENIRTVFFKCSSFVGVVYRFGDFKRLKVCVKWLQPTAYISFHLNAICFGEWQIQIML